MTLAVGNTVRLRVAQRCPRCVMTTLAQPDFPADPGVLRAAARHNAGHVGVYLVVTEGGVVQVGDAVRELI